MLLLGDIAVDHRRNRINMHRSDYLLRDVSKPWRQLAANVPLYASWDDHDYMHRYEEMTGRRKWQTKCLAFHKPLLWCCNQKTRPSLIQMHYFS